MAKFTATFKVHRVEPRDRVDGKAREERVLLHPTDPHEPGKNTLMLESRSGYGQIKVNVTAPAALGRFKEGALIDVSFDIPE